MNRVILTTTHTQIATAYTSAPVPFNGSLSEIRSDDLHFRTIKPAILYGWLFSTRQSTRYFYSLFYGEIKSLFRYKCATHIFITPLKDIIGKLYLCQCNMACTKGFRLILDNSLVNRSAKFDSDSS